MKIHFANVVISIISIVTLSACSTSNPLNYSIRQNNLPLTKSILTQVENKEDIDAALFVAVERSNLEASKLLLKKGANVNAENGEGETPIARVFLWDYPAFLNMSNSERNAEIEYHTKQRPTGQKLEVLKLLIKNKANINHPNKYGKTPLHLAVDACVAEGGTHEDYCEAMRHLLKVGAYINAQDDGGKTPLHSAVVFHSVQVANLLLNHGAKIDIPIIEGITPLMTAYEGGDEEMVKLLLSKGANPSLKDKNGNTASDYAAQYRKTDEAARASKEAAYARQQRGKEESREMWRGLATLGTGIAVGNATRDLPSDQQTRMMRSSMEAVDSGDASGFSDTSRQVRGEQAQAHQDRMREIEAQKERERARERSAGNQTAPSSRANNTDANTPQGNGSSPKQEKWKPAFTATWSVCKQRALVSHLACGANTFHGEAFTAADVSASAQSKLCSKAKQKALNPIDAVVVEDLGCGCDLGPGSFSCTYYTLWKGNGSRGTGGGRAK